MKEYKDLENKEKRFFDTLDYFVSQVRLPKKTITVIMGLVLNKYRFKTKYVRLKK